MAMPKTQQVSKEDYDREDLLHPLENCLVRERKAVSPFLVVTNFFLIIALAEMAS
jgi:hypothetical protein